MGRECEPLWPGGKVLGWNRSGLCQFNSGRSALVSRFGLAAKQKDLGNSHSLRYNNRETDT